MRKMQLNREKKFYTVPDFHKLIGGVVTRPTIYSLIKRGEIPSVRLGTCVLIPAAWVSKFCESSGMV